VTWPCRVSGWGTALPPQVVTNQDLEQRLDTSDEWIVARSGIRERRVGGSLVELASAAAKEALARAQLAADQVDLLVLSTTTPEETVPHSSAAVHQRLGLGGGALDLNAACAGFVYGMVVAAGALATVARRVLLVGADTLSRITNPEDRATAVLFADGAGAVLLERPEEGDEGDAVPGVLAADLGTDGSAHDLLRCPHGGWLSMEGREVFRRAVRLTVSSAESALARAGLEPADVDLFVPHQANLRIIEAAGERLGIPAERTAVVVDRTGNTSSASIPLALAEALDAGRVPSGGVVLLSGFGAGMSWASCVLRWGPAAPPEAPAARSATRDGGDGGGGEGSERHG
jgi:3-oxoacyl-[acyl-carrier-protein] synthase-3